MKCKKQLSWSSWA